MTPHRQLQSDLVVAQSARELLPLLADRLRAPLPDPFTPDIIVVPTAGTRDWLIEQLGHRLDPGTGEAILANVQFWFPNEFNFHAIGVQRTLDDPWSVKRLRWTVLGLLSSNPSLAPGFANAKSPFASAQRIADLFDRYSVYRPEMPATWAVGTEADPIAPLRPDKQWQFSLWQAVRTEIGASTGERFIAARGRLDAEAVAQSLPGRLSIFGLDVYSPAKVSLLAELSQLMDLSVFAVFPAPELSARLGATNLGDHLRSQIDLSSALRNPLLRSWSRAGLESMALLAHSFPKLEVCSAAAPNSVLGRLQTSIASNSPLSQPANKKTALERGDGSVEVHFCHGPTRQVEVLRDALLHRLAADETLHPRDIIVICPDLETYAPLLGPVMGAEFHQPALGNEPGGRLQLPIAIIDKTTSTSTPIADAIAALFDAIGNRLELSKVLELLALEPVRRRFAIDDDAFATIDRWLSDLQVHWGIDDAYRAGAPWKYPSGVEAGTWRIAIDRLLNGVLVQSVEPRETLGGVVAYDDISGSSIDLVGSLASFFDRLSECVDLCAVPRPPVEWADALERLLPAFFDDPSDDRNQLLDALDVVHELRAYAAEAAGSATLGFREIAGLFAEELDGVRSRSRVWGDVVRIASLSRLRGVPARVVALLGFDDRAFASGRGSGDDILLDAPRIGERDFHAEERLGVLNLITAASDAVVITANGFDVTNNKELPIAVPLAEFIDAVAGVLDVTPIDGATTPVLIRHARQLTDPVNFGRPSQDENKNVVHAVEGSWTFDPVAAKVARRILDVAGEQPIERQWPDFEWDPSDFDRSSLSLETLVNAMKRPAEVYLRERLQISLPNNDESSDDQVKLWPGNLEYSKIGSDLVRARLHGEKRTDRQRLRQLMGGVPIGAVGDRFWGTIGAEVEAMLATPGVDFASDVRIPVQFEIGDAGVYDTIECAQSQIVEIAFSNSHRRHVLRPWLMLAALTLTDPETVRDAIVLARSTKKNETIAVERFRLAGDSSAERFASAHRVLSFALDVHKRALCSPLPLFERASWADPTKPTNVNKGLSSDLSNASAAAIFGGSSFATFTDSADPANLLHPIDDGVAESGTRFQAYAWALQNCFKETTVES